MNFHKLSKNGRYVNKLTGGGDSALLEKKKNIEGRWSIFTPKLLRKGILGGDLFHGSSLV